MISTENCRMLKTKSFRLQDVSSENKFNSISHHPVSGHIQLPSDCNFELIENRHRKYGPEMYSPTKLLKKA